MPIPTRIIDSHIHFYDHKANVHPFLDEFDPNYAAFVGDYSTMARKYLLENYLEDSTGYQIDGIVWHEFLSTDPIKEAKWAHNLANQTSIAQSMVVIIDFLDPGLEKKLELYSSLHNVTAVREHMVWDNENPKKRFAKRPNLLSDPTWQKGLAVLNNYNFKCGLEVFAPQLKELINVIQSYPNIGFTLAVMGWPLDLSEEGYKQWRQDLKRLSKFQNICVDISAIECIFGMEWTLNQVRPWILSVIEFFGSTRCMFGSHMPIAKLSSSFDNLYCTYESITANFSSTEKASLFHDVAADWFKL
ncbi:MAG: amidohydrolase family protein [Tatlockia sp.]|nr:amidohydrolase family protein [Tatlockia sp.]